MFVCVVVNKKKAEEERRRKRINDDDNDDDDDDDGQIYNKTDVHIALSHISHSILLLPSLSLSPP